MAGSSKRQDWKPLLYAALTEPFGLLLTTNDPTRAKAQLYAARVQACDNALACLQIRSWPLGGPNQLALVKGPSSTATGNENNQHEAKLADDLARELGIS